MQMPNTTSHQNMPPPQSWGHPPQSFPIDAGGGPGFGLNSQHLQPPRQHSYYPHPDISPMDKQLHQHPPMYGRDASIGHLLNSQPQKSVVTKVFFRL